VLQPLKLVGTDEQKRRFLPRLARGAISAFALTEIDAGSDPANMRTTATPTEDGAAYLLNGEKLWCTNGPDAELLVVMAITQSVRPGGGKARKGITAFIVESRTPGVEVAHRCEFMGLMGRRPAYVVERSGIRTPSSPIAVEPDGAAVRSKPSRAGPAARSAASARAHPVAPA
jgi:alkylation response protein AidB-like acyl-CoA dehydrogenase